MYNIFSALSLLNLSIVQTAKESSIQEGIEANIKILLAVAE